MFQKIKILTAALVATLLFSVSSVYASDLSGNISCIDGGSVATQLGVTKFSYSYDSVNDITVVNAEISLTESVLGTVLNQAPGNSGQAASLGSFYMTMSPTIPGTGSYYNYTNNVFNNSVSIADAKSKVASLMDVESGPGPASPNVWPTLLQIQYNKTGTWTNVTNKSNGGLSIKANLMTLLGVTNESDLVYGQNYRFYMPTDTYQLYAFEKATTAVAWDNAPKWTPGVDSDPVASSVRATRQFIQVTYNIKFPITANINSLAVNYFTLEEAIASGSTDIIVNDNITVSTDITIPAGVTVTVASGKTLTVASGNKITNNGKLVGNVSGKVDTPTPEDTPKIEPPKPPVAEKIVDPNTGVKVASSVIKSGGIEYQPGELNLVVNSKAITEDEKTKYAGDEVLNKLNEKFSDTKYTGIDILSILDISLLAGTTNLTSFEDGLTLHVPYDAAKYGADNLHIIYVGDDGTVEVLPIKSVSDGILEFTVYHLSSYVLAQGTSTNTEPNPNTGDLNVMIISMTTLGALILGIIIIRQILKHKRM